MICAGIDAGSRAIKVALFDHSHSRVVHVGLADQGVLQPQIAESLYDRTLAQAGLARSDISGVVATGYGRNRVAFAKTTITEITCHACGVHFAAPSARAIVEIGGQDSKIIKLDGNGRVRDFAMNDRCAAGTGRFLEIVAARLGVDLTALGEMSLESKNPAPISSTCVVFAETEIIGLLADGVPPPDIVSGVQNAIATRVIAMAGRALEEPIFFTGGVALQDGMVRALNTALGCEVRVPGQPQYTGAIGAAILAGHRAAPAG